MKTDRRMENIQISMIKMESTTLVKDGCATTAHKTSDQDGLDSIRIAIIGAGMVGMTIACSLKKSGFSDVHIFEKAESARFEGLYIGFQPNSFIALDKMDILDKDFEQMILDNSKINKFTISDYEGNIWRKIPYINTSSINDTYVGTNLFRRDVLTNLLNNCNKLGVNIHYNKKLTKINCNDNDDTITLGFKHDTSTNNNNFEVKHNRCLRTLLFSFFFFFLFFGLDSLQYT